MRECAPFTYSSQKQTNQMLYRHVWGVTATFAPVLQHRSWTGWVDVTVWASLPDSASSSSSSSLGPQQLLQEQWFEKKVAHVWEGGVALKDYVVLTRLSSCLMAVRREKEVCHIWVFECSTSSMWFIFASWQNWFILSDTCSCATVSNNLHKNSKTDTI